MENQNIEQFITLTDSAIKMIQDVIEKEGLEGYGLRIVAMQGCCGIQYGLDFDDTANEGDEIIEVGGFKVYMDIDTAPILRGTKIDYINDIHGSGFKFTNPNTTQNQDCRGCGSSGCGSC